MHVCVGGTFNILHKGHKQLFDKAFQIASKNGKVFIGVTKGEILKKKKIVKKYNERVNAIKKYLQEKGYDKHVVFKPIYDKYGLAIDWDFDVIVVSPESLKNAKEINKVRVEKSKKPLEIVQISFVLADDNKPISSTRVQNNEIDINGKLIKKNEKVKYSSYNNE